MRRRRRSLAGRAAAWSSRTFSSSPCASTPRQRRVVSNRRRSRRPSSRPRRDEPQRLLDPARPPPALQARRLMDRPLPLHSGTTDAMYLYDSTSTPYIVIARNSFLATVSRIGAAVCVWDLRPGALLYRLEHALSRQVSTLAPYGSSLHPPAPSGSSLHTPAPSGNSGVGHQRARRDARGLPPHRCAP